MQEFINLIITNGIAVVIVAYFLFKDYKFNGQIIELMQEIREVLAVISNKEDKER